jgi:predicted DNA-binding antitoxin AbrB/MazE fold protein
MLTTVEGIYENGQIILKEKPKVNHKVKVIVTFTDEVAEDEKQPNKPLSAKLRGAWKGINKEDQKDIKTYFENIRNEWERDI